MRARSAAAAAAGALLIAASVSAFALAKHPPIAGTNSVAPLAPEMWVGARRPYCQRVSRIPGGANGVRLVIDALTPRADSLRLAVRSARRTIAVGTASGVRPGRVVIRLQPLTRPSHPASICLSNPSYGGVLLAGEMKRTPGFPRKVRRPAVSVVFLRPGQSSWASRGGLIAERYANAQTGWLGGWTLWLALGTAVLAGLLSLYWLVFRLDPRAARSRRPRRPPGAGP